MFAAIGLLGVFICVFGSFMIFGGKIGIILEALPGEFMTIGGAAICGFMVANSTHTIKQALGAVKRIFPGAKFHKKEYMELLSLLYQILKTMKTKGVLAIEQHIEKPLESNIFNAYPSIMKDPFTVKFIADYLRMFSIGVDNPHELEALMEQEIEKAKHEDLHSSHAFQTMADAMPALGIVAAVLGVIKTMASITEPPEVLGKLIGGALVGTFMGIFLSYCIIAPIASRLKGVAEEENQFYHVIRAAITSHLAGYAPQVSIEAARKKVPTEYMPDFNELEEALSAIS
ncbi:flagellar motor stator protein MotA [Nitrospirillum sp. BR 11163]|uniref:flagellar motor stator protein MotA n=1 Tax=Nitrospirillum sp. BR 11163 TaxID=3104323 RepID=UPI002AFFB6AE|nr:flagellar motor stator protein MotA [Nitrospirillum sp. BR 11163]MEA1675334.1 flagellar motor stator protein MotA [Nitrospirillum sp. BR 11163]